jgi:hypothetical protein
MGIYNFIRSVNIYVKNIRETEIQHHKMSNQMRKSKITKYEKISLLAERGSYASGVIASVNKGEGTPGILVFPEQLNDFCGGSMLD